VSMTMVEYGGETLVAWVLGPLICWWGRGCFRQPSACALERSCYGDVLSDPGLVESRLLGPQRVLQAGARLARDPTVQARANALMGRLYHGNRNEPWSVAQSRPFEQRAGNWFRRGFVCDTRL
jgi:hypothetical protein